MEFLGSPVLTNFLLGIVVLLLVLIAWLTNILYREILADTGGLEF